MSLIDNNNFSRDTKLTETDLNQKFQDVETATGQLTEANVRDQGVDLPQFGTTTSGQSGIILKKLVTSNVLNVAATITSNDNATPTQADTVLGAVLTVNQACVTGDILRVYWSAKVKTNFVYAGAFAGAATNYRYQFWALWPQWSINAGAYTEVTGQSDFSTDLGYTAYDGVNNAHGNTMAQNYACTFIPHREPMDDGTTPVNTTADPTGAGVVRLSGGSSAVGKTGAITTVYGSYYYKFNANQTLTGLRLVGNGLMSAAHNGGNNYVVLNNGAYNAATNPEIVVTAINMTCMIMRGA